MEMYESINMMMETMGAIGSAVAALVAVVGLIEAFFGFKIMKACFALCGFLGGAAVGFIGTGLVLSEPVPCAIAALVAGIIGALILYKVYILGVFLSNTFLSAVVLFVVCGIALDMGASAVGIALVGGAIVGVVSCIFVRWCTIITTALGGGMMAGQAVVVALQMDSYIVGVLLGIVFAVIGVIFQLKTTKDTKADGAVTEKPAKAKRGKLGKKKAAEEIAAPVMDAQMAEMPAMEIPTVEQIAEEKPETLAEKKLAEKTGGKKVSGKTIGIVAALVVVLAAGGIFAAKGAFGPKMITVDEAAGIKIEASGFTDAYGNDIYEDMIWLNDDANVRGMYQYGDETVLLCATSNGYKMINGAGETVIESDRTIYHMGEVDGMPWFQVAGYTGPITFVNIYGETMLDVTDIVRSNTNGSWISELNSFHYGVLAFDGFGGYGAIDYRGNVLVPFSVDCGRMNYNEYGTYYISEGFFGTAGLADASGNIVIPMECRELYHVDDNRIIASRLNEESKVVWGAYDTSGNIVEEFVYSSENDIRNQLGLEAVSTSNGSVSYAGDTENLDSVEYIGDGFFKLYTYNYETEEYGEGIAKADGTIIIEPVYEYADMTKEAGIFYAVDENGAVFYDFNGTAKTPAFGLAENAWVECKEVMTTAGKGVLPQLLTADELAAYDSYAADYR